VEVKYTQKPGSGADGRYLPGDPSPALVAHPIADSRGVVLGGEDPALSLREMAMTNANPIDMDVEVTSLDAPDLEVPERYATMAGTNAVGRVEAIEMAHSFRCFLCGWTLNNSFGLTSGVIETPGRHTFISVAKFEWRLSGRGKFSLSSDSLDGVPTTKVNPTTFFSPVEARKADCEVREPGSLDCLRAVVS